MKINKTLTALIAGASLGLSGQVIAAATSKAGVDITNSASLTYTVGSSSTTSTSTDDAKFTVDKKIDFTTSVFKSDSKVYAGLSESTETRLFTFTVINEGNSDQYFKITDDVAKYAIGTASIDTTVQDFQIGNIVIHLDNNTTFGDALNPYAAGVVEAELMSENFTDVFVAGSDRVVVHIEADLVPSIAIGNYRDKNSDLELTYADDLTGAKSFTELTVFPITGSGGTQITVDDSNAPFERLTVQTVFADDDTDGFGVELLDAQFALQSAYVSLSKDATVIATGITGYAGSVMHFLPGSTVEYTLSATNEGDLAAEDVTVTDDLTTTEISGNAVYDYSSLELESPLPDGITTGTGHNTATGNIVLNFGTLDETGGTTPNRTVKFTVNVQQFL